MKPLALDLCCGLGGWAEGLIAAGWDVIGVDIEERFRATYPGFFISANVRSLAATWHISIWDRAKVWGIDVGHQPFSLVVASPPCQEFSRHDQPWTKKRNPPPPDTSIWEACVRIAEDCGALLILENVRGAQKWMGSAAWHCGSYYLWGAVPALMPQVWSGPKSYKRAGRQPGCLRPGEFRSKTSRTSNPAERAKIPFDLALHIGRVFHPGDVIQEADLPTHGIRRLDVSHGTQAWTPVMPELSHESQPLESRDTHPGEARELEAAQCK